MGPQLRRKEKEPLGKTISVTQVTHCTWCRKFLDGHSRGDNFDLLRQELAKMGQEVFLDVVTARLQVVGMARAEAVSDLSAQPPRPAEELRMMNLLNIVHDHNGGLVVV